MDTEYLINYILSGTIHFQYKCHPYQIKPPTLDLRYRASLYYNQLLDELKYDGLLSHKSLMSPQYHSAISTLEKRLSALRVQLFYAYKNSYFIGIDKFHKDINLVTDKLKEVRSVANSYFFYTPEGYAHEMKQRYLLSNTVFRENGKQLFKVTDEHRVDSLLLYYIYMIYIKHTLNDKELRGLAKSPLWRNLWSVGNMSLFSGNVKELTDNQLTMCIYSQMYDNVYESMDCPTSNVISDDDALDGWYVVQSEDRKRMRLEREKRDKQTKGGGGNSLSVETFIPISNRADIQKVQSLNTIEATNIKKMRQNIIKAKGEVFEQELPDIQQKRSMQAVQQRTK